MAAQPDPAPDALYKCDEAEAWGRYLRDTRPQSGDRYEAIEPWAWQRLTLALKASRARLLGRRT